MQFPKIGKLRKGGYYVMPILGNCTLHFPVSDVQEEAEALINEVESYSLMQQAIGKVKDAHSYNVEIELEPDDPELA